MDELSARQRQVLYIVEQNLAEGKPFPSLREIATQMGIGNKSGVVGHLRSLERKGYIKKRSQRVSDFTLTSQGEEVMASFVGFDLVAAISAGAPKMSYEQQREKLIFNQNFFGGGNLIALEIIGESMNGDAISDGDIAIIKLQAEASPQDIVAVRVGTDEATLKRLRYRGEWIDLLPSNPAFMIKTVASDQVQILGKLVGVVRKA